MKIIFHFAGGKDGGGVLYLNIHVFDQGLFACNPRQHFSEFSAYIYRNKLGDCTRAWLYFSGLLNFLCSATKVA